jgi:hypothetical protein
MPGKQMGYERRKLKKEVIAMNEDRKKQIAVFRFGVIHEFVGGVFKPHPGQPGSDAELDQTV